MAESRWVLSLKHFAKIRIGAKPPLLTYLPFGTSAFRSRTRTFGCRQEGNGENRPRAVPSRPRQTLVELGPLRRRRFHPSHRNELRPGAAGMDGGNIEALQ